jgi:hypothetical protein
MAKKTEKAEKPGRVTVTAEDFIRVAIVEREKFDSKEKAAAELGMTVNSYAQRLSRERKHMPAVFEGVPHYKGDAGPKRISEDEGLAILKKLKGTPAKEGE